MLADAFEALKKYDWGTDLSALEPIDNAAIAPPGTASADPELEKQLLAARDYVVLYTIRAAAPATAVSSAT